MTSPLAIGVPGERELYVSSRQGLASGEADWEPADGWRRSGLPELPLVALTRLVGDRARHEAGSGARLGSHLRGLGERIGATSLVSSWPEANGRRFEAFQRHFTLDGDVPPAVNDDIVYFSSLGGTQTMAILAPPAGLGACAVLHCMAYVPSGSADHFHLCLHAADGRVVMSIRLGTESLTITPGGTSLGQSGKTPRLYSLAADAEGVALYINGALVWRRHRGDDAPLAGVRLALLARSAVGTTDGALFELDLWSLPGPFAGFDPDEPRRLDELVGDLVRQGDLLALHDLLVNVEGLGVGPREEELAAAMAQQARREQGHREWLFDGLARALSPAARERWAATAAAILPSPAVTVSYLSARLAKNPARDLSLRRLLGRRGRREFLVLDGVDFRVFPGDVVGIIGPNGAGKSTLLRALAGLVPIDGGRILVRGNHLLLRGGLGLRLELTGRQNVTSLGIHMGLSLSEIAALVEEIVAFSELGEHIDKPVKYYSDGMLSRLVFATATSVSPEILMLDELLGAGDIRFQAKAQARLHELIARARVVLVVTHSVTFVREHCNKALVLSGGRQLYFGDPRQAVAHYLTDLQG